MSRRLRNFLVRRQVLEAKQLQRKIGEECLQLFHFLRFVVGNEEGTSLMTGEAPFLQIDDFLDAPAGQRHQLIKVAFRERLSFSGALDLDNFSAAGHNDISYPRRRRIFPDNINPAPGLPFTMPTLIAAT